MIILLPRGLDKGLPANEVEAIRVARHHLRSLGKQIDRISSALRLLDIARGDPGIFRPSQRDEFKRLFASWVFFAAREIIITVDDFHKSLTAAKTMFDRCKSLRGRFVIPLEKARSDFVGRFPKHDDLRNVACHLVDYSLKPHDVEKHSLSEPVSAFGIDIGEGSSKVMVGENLSNRTIAYTANGEFLSLDLVDDIVISLERIVHELAKSCGLQVL